LSKEIAMSETYTKPQLIDKIAGRTGLTKTDTQKFLEAFVGVVTDAMKQGDAVRISGLGTFSAVERSPRKGRNPATGEPIDVPASTSPKFKASATLKTSLNG
jgi:DNA-binding protein HU-beta